MTCALTQAPASTCHALSAGSNPQFIPWQVSLAITPVSSHGRTYVGQPALPAAVWGVTLGVFLLGLPMLAGATAFDCASSIATAGLCLAYAMPICFRLALAHDSFEPGPFTLGR